MRLRSASSELAEEGVASEEAGHSKLSAQHKLKLGRRLSREATARDIYGKAARSEERASIWAAGKRPEYQVCILPPSPTCGGINKDGG